MELLFPESYTVEIDKIIDLCGSSIQAAALHRVGEFFFLIDLSELT